MNAEGSEAESPPETPNPTSTQSEEARRRVRRVFSFLRAFAERRAPTITTLAQVARKLRLADLPDHPSIRLGAVSLKPTSGKGAGVTNDEDDDARSAEPLLRVRRPLLTKAPAPPDVLSDWVQKGWERPDGKIAVWGVRNRRTRGGKLVADRFGDEVARTRALSAWTRTWKQWSEVERPARAAMRVFETLYALHADIEREGERIELVLGDGRLRLGGSNDDGKLLVDHPVLLQRVDLVFDPDVPEFRVVDSDRGPELYAPALLGVGTLPGEKLNDLGQELEVGGFHPLAGEETSGFLRRLSSLLGPTGEFRETPGEELLQEAGDGAPVLVRDAWLLVRDRAAGFAAAFDRVLEDLDRGGPLPAALNRVVGIAPPAEAMLPASTDLAADLLLSKPANAEQIAIVRALERNRAVLVQGPPGTGKSHTIANLVGHLVAQGKRVLVTSYTTKALRVLRDQIVEELRPLCVSVLDNDLAGRTQMEHAVRGIVHRLSGSTEQQLEQELATLTHNRAELLGEIARITADLTTIRQSEYAPILVGDEEVAPADAARHVESTSHLYDWLPGPVPAGTGLPLTDAELGTLYASNDSLSADAEAELARELPARDSVLPPDDAAEAIIQIETTKRPESNRYFGALPDAADATTLDTIERGVERLLREVAALSRWQRALVTAGRAGDAEADLWRELTAQVQAAAQAFAAAQSLILTHAPTIAANPGMNLRDLIAVLRELSAHVETGGQLGNLSLMFRGRWRTALDACRVNGQPPTAPAHFAALAALAEIHATRAELAVRWARQAEAQGLPAFATLPDPPEPALSDYVQSFERLLEFWPTRWEPIERQLVALKFTWQDFRADELARAAPAPAFERDLALVGGPLRAVLAERRHAIGRLAALRQLKSLADRLDDYPLPACKSLARAARELDSHGYRRDYGRLAELWRKAEILEERKALLRKLATAAPAWAAAVEKRRGVHGALTPPRELAKAWRWRQLQQELEQRASRDERAATRRLEALQGQLQDVTIDLVDRRAWLAQLRRTDLEARQALIGWADTQRKIGKGTGKRAPALQRRARELLTRARDAVPVWIMPLSRVAESFDPRQSRFDVVIVDEASQCDLLGLFALSLADGAVIVGDHEQVSPSAIGEASDDINGLISQYLVGIPNSHLYDGQTSVYDLGRQSFGETIGLREHFRCVPDIIGFSNHLSYGGQIRPLRDPDTAQRPHTVEYPIPTAFAPDREGKVNDAEARAVAALTAAAMALPEYEGKTFGAISLLGDDQAARIQSLTQKLVPLGELERRRFVAGNPAQFQGDERDVIFLSMVDVPGEHALPLQERASFKQRYNVASSRAKDQLWLVHSLDPHRDLQTTDLRRRLIEHIQNPGAAAESAPETVRTRRRTPSAFEAEVLAGLRGAGFQADTQVDVGGYRIDIVVSDGRRRVAIECDGDRVQALDRVADEMARQAVLERVGWRFIRLRSTKYFRDPARAIESLIAELGRLGIEPGAGKTASAAASSASADDADNLRNKVIRRAFQIMRDAGWIEKPTPVVSPEETGAVPEFTGSIDVTEELSFDDTTEPNYVILEESATLDASDTAEVTRP
ncbi:MAG TPA: AAA domain-containing protein [Polyangia bacterium]